MLEKLATCRDVPRCRCASSPRHSRLSTAFTLIEMLVVLTIMAMLAALAVPALKNFGHADAMTAADQQMLNDVARARQLAISQRTTVYMVFVPANFWNNNLSAALTGPARHDQFVRQAIDRLHVCRLRRGGRPAGTTTSGIISRRGSRCRTARSSPNGNLISPTQPFQFNDPVDPSRIFLDLSALLTPTPFRFPRKRTLPPSAPLLSALHRLQLSGPVDDERADRCRPTRIHPAGARQRVAGGGPGHQDVSAPVAAGL